MSMNTIFRFERIKYMKEKNVLMSENRLNKRMSLGVEKSNLNVKSVTQSFIEIVLRRVTKMQDVEMESLLQQLRREKGLERI